MTCILSIAVAVSAHQQCSVQQLTAAVASCNVVLLVLGTTGCNNDGLCYLLYVYIIHLVPRACFLPQPSLILTAYRVSVSGLY